MRILYPANIRLPSERASTIQITNTCHALARQGAQVELVVRWMRNAREKESLAFYGLEPIPGLRLRRLPVVNLPQPRLWNGSFYLSLALWALTTARWRPFDLVYTREGFVARLFTRLKRWHGARVVYERHDLTASLLDAYESSRAGQPVPWEAMPPEVIRERQACEAADGVVTVTRHAAAALQEVLGVQRPTTVIPNGVAVGAMPPGDTPAVGEPFIGYTGQLYGWKGVNTLIEAMDYLESPAKLLVVGGRPNSEAVDLAEMAELHHMIAASRRGQDIVLTGFVEPRQVASYLARCQVALLTLSDEIVPRYCNCPLKLLEYMAAGKPIVAPRLPAIEEILTDGQNARLVEPGNPQALAQAIDSLLTNPELARRLGVRAFQDAHRYSWQERARAILAFVAGPLGEQN